MEIAVLAALSIFNVIVWREMLHTLRLMNDAVGACRARTADSCASSCGGPVEGDAVRKPHVERMRVFVPPIDQAYRAEKRGEALAEINQLDSEVK
jgi:hypothetical protein